MLPFSEFNNDVFSSPVFVATISGLMVLGGALLNQSFHLWSKKKRHERDVNIRLVESEIRKQENIQSLQLQALKDLCVAHQDALPNIWSSPDSDAHDAYVRILYHMPNLLKQINSYLRSYNYIIPDKVADHLNMVLYKCNQGHWGASTSEQPAYEPSEYETELAKGVLELLIESITAFKRHLGISIQ